MLHAVLFDMGGTLAGGFLGTDREIEAVCRKVGEGRPMARKLLNATVRRFNEQRARDLATLEQHTFTEALVSVANEQQPPMTGTHLWELHGRIFGALVAPAGPFCETAGVLEALRGIGIMMGIVSNVSFPGRYYERLLGFWHLRQYFPVRVWSSEIGVRKPHPDIFYRALDELGITAADALYVGDTLDRDVVGAQRVRMRAALVDRENAFMGGGGIRPDWVIPDLSGLLPIVEGL